MADSAAVAGLLWDWWVPVSVRRLVAGVLPEGAEDARRLLVWLAAVHDVGKATPAFACQVEDLAEAMRAVGLGMGSRGQLSPDRRLVPHALAGQLLVEEWLTERHGWSLRQAGQLSVLVGGHHGVVPDPVQVKVAFDREELLRTPSSASAWRRVQDQLLDGCAAECGVTDRLPMWRGVALPQTVQVVLVALVIVADWVASNTEFFPYFPDAAGVPDAERVTRGWEGVDLPRPWAATDPGADVAALFAARFALPGGAAPRPVQAATVQLARRMPGAGMLLVEAPMGEGKTEAALAAAEVFAARFGAGGVFYALPTMATSNGIFPRLLDWLHRLPVGAGDRFSVQLAHAKAALNTDLQQLRWVGRRGPSSVGIDEHAEPPRPGEALDAGALLVAHQWMRGRKKTMLASFVAGTIDQLLFAGLKSRHLMLRHLAVAGKVVVVDEAHAFDTYMNVYLDRVLGWLGAYGVPVIVLSATLPPARRAELAAAYTRQDASDFAPVATASGYPLVTAVVAGHEPIIEAPAASSRASQVRLERLSDELPVLVDRLEADLVDGGCVLVVRNTVSRVFATARALRQRFGDDAVTVAHARFVDIDRAVKDADLLARFGPPATSASRRPAGLHIVVASQTVEQSLDVDFDLLVSDLCPVDLLLQRIGRLHRHPRRRPHRLREPRCLLTGVTWGADDTQPPAAVRGSVTVYGSYPLLRAAAVLLPHLASGGPALHLPGDISRLVHAAYAEPGTVPDRWGRAVEQARVVWDRTRRIQQVKAKDFRLDEVGRDGTPLTGWTTANVGDADDTPSGHAQVRDTPPTLEVLVVQRSADGTLRTLPPLSEHGEPDPARAGLELPEDRVPSPAVAQAAARCGLRLPREFSAPAVMDQAIAELKQTYIPAWQGTASPWLSGELILVLDEQCRTRLAGFDLSYSRLDGLEVTRG